VNKIHADYKYIDLAINGANNRNHITTMDQVASSVPIDDTVDAYTSMFLFKEELKLHVDDTGSVSGASRFSVWSPYVWFDIDAADLEVATIDMQALLRGFDSMGLLPYTVIFFSGSKGYHIGVNSGIFGLEPSVDLPNCMRCICNQMASLFSITIDNNIYNHNRLWRIVNTLHSKTGIRKTAIDINVAMTSDVEILKKLASDNIGNDGPHYISCEPVKAMDTMVTFAQEALSGMVKRQTTWIAPSSLPDHYLREIEAGLEYLLNHGVAEGNRDNEALLRASECRKLGIAQDDCLIKLSKWNELNDPPKNEEDLQRIVQSAYTGDGYDFGLNNKSLSDARKRSKGDFTDDDIIRLLDNKHGIKTGESEKRRPRTLTELLEEGIDMKPLETLGDYFTWRQRITLLAGREKSTGKSTLCTFEAIAAMRKGYKVMWISPDEPRADILYRLIKAGAVDYADNIFISGDTDVPSSWYELVIAIRDVNPDIVILDSIHSLLPVITGELPDNSDGAKWQRLVSRLRPLAVKLDMAIVWIHHGNKASGTPTGSIGITAAVDVIVSIDPPFPLDSTKRTLHFIGRRIPQSRIDLEYINKEKGYKLVKIDKEAIKDESQRDIMANILIDLMRTYPTDIIPRSKMIEACEKELGKSISAKNGTFAAALGKLVNSEILKKVEFKDEKGRFKSCNYQINRDNIEYRRDGYK